MALASYDDIIERIGSGYAQWQPIWGETPASTVIFSGNNSAMQRIGFTADMPGSLPTGITDFFVASAYLDASIADAYLLAKLIDMGSLDISGASGTFTDGNTMPSEAELGNSAAPISGPVFIEVTTALNATPGNLSVTYTNQDGTTGQVTSAQALPASGPVRSAGFMRLQITDTGARDITAASRSAGTTPTGVIKFWGIIPIGFICSPGSNRMAFRNFLTSGFNPYPLGAGDKLGVFSVATTTSRAITGGLTIVGGS